MSPVTNPWADTANQAVGALYKHYMTKPSQAEMQQQQLNTQLLDAKLKNEQLGYQQGQFDLSQQQEQNQFADMFANAITGAPQIGAELPVQQGQIGPNPAATIQDRNAEIATIFEQFAPRLDKDRVSAARDALGTASALRFEDPIQRQLAIDEKATSYDSYSPDYTLSPGSVRFDVDNQQVASAPFKQGGGSYIEQPDGTIISIDGGQPPLRPSVVGDIQTRDMELDVYETISQNYRSALAQNPGAAGTRGNVARLADGLLGQVKSLAPNSPFKAQLEGVVDNMAGQFTDPQTGEIINEDIYAASTVANIMPFIAASAIVGQSGKSLSDEDRRIIQGVFGSPDDWLATPEKLMARLNQGDMIVDQLRQKYQGRLTNSQNPGLTQPPVTPNQPTVIKSDADYEALPSGTQFIAPDGTTRVKP